MATNWISGYPLITSNTTGTTVTASGSMNQSGVIYSVIVPSASGIPSSANIAAGNDASGNALGAGFVDSSGVAASGTAVPLTGYALTSETSYVMYVVASGYDDGIQSSGWGLPFTTPDITAPSWSAGYPSVGSITTSTAVVSMSITDAGSGYFVILPSGYGAYPSYTQVIAGTDGNDVAISAGLYGSTALTSGTAATVNVSNLAYSTRYAIYYVGVDDGTNYITGGVGQSPYTTCGTFRAALPNVAPVFSVGRRARERRRRRNQVFRGLMNRA